ncbi:hypothetical protein BDN72DRAFT_496612 [Pluteus cervinus]|uniref:Uncharacterized protein n=1 Tax=Pluteus cervinus TaxID=181527 RepID=A0ACD3B063_9AGAR|nr:hypothetical protein BDN72DRAFT_496612 [Pluteus cervinus]
MQLCNLNFFYLLRQLPRRETSEHPITGILEVPTQIGLVTRCADISGSVETPPHTHIQTFSNPAQLQVMLTTFLKISKTLVAALPTLLPSFPSSLRSPQNFIQIDIPHPRVVRLGNGFLKSIHSLALPVTVAVPLLVFMASHRVLYLSGRVLAQFASQSNSKSTHDA